MIEFQGGRRSRVDLDLMRYSSQDGVIQKIGHWTNRNSLVEAGSKMNGNDNAFDDEIVYEDLSQLNAWQEGELANRPTGGLSILNDSLIDDNETEVITLTVVTKEEKPYVMLRPGKRGNEAFDGFAIDLLKVGYFVRSSFTLIFHANGTCAYSVVNLVCQP